MEFSVKSGSPEKQRSACIVVGVFEPRRLSASVTFYAGAIWKANPDKCCCSITCLIY